MSTPESSSENTTNTTDDNLQGMQYSPSVQKYAFNQTGNIFISISEGVSEEASANFSNICAEVSVFFASLTKAIHSVINPKTNKPYSIYNYEALNKVITKSSMFVPMQSQDFIFSSDLAGSELAEEMMQTILNVQLPKFDLSFATETINCMANEEDETDDDDDSNRAANIVFKCECLMGMPMVTVIVSHFHLYEAEDDEAETTEVKSVSKQSKVKTVRAKRGFSLFKKKKRKAKKVSEVLNPADKEESRNWHFQKETYLFIPPKYFKDFVLDMSHLESPDYKQLVQHLSNVLEDEDVNTSSEKN